MEGKIVTSINDQSFIWLEHTPKNWTIKKLNYLCEISTGNRDTQDSNPEGLYPFFVRSDKVEKINTYTHDEEAVLTAGDGVGVGKVFHYFEGKFSAHQRVYIFSRFKGVLGKFIYYYLKSNLRFEVLRSNAKSTVDSLRRPMLSEFPIAVPPIAVQNKIINFLDRKTVEINTLIADKEKLITLLEEKRQAVITEAMTKGLNPGVEMKDSGVEWIGEIPTNWEIKRMKFVININPSKSEINKDQDIDVTFIPMENITSIGVVDTSITRHLSEVHSGYSYFRKNDILIAKVTPCFENGNIAVAENLANDIGFGTTEFHVIRIKELYDIKFFYYFFQLEEFKQKAISEMYGVAGLKRIPADFITNYKTALPGLEEQQSISSHLDIVTNEIQVTVGLIEKQVRKLKKYRQSLIYEAVTGKIDVRDYM